MSEGPGPEEDAGPAHEEDGLDLARSIARAYRGARSTPRRAARRGSGRRSWTPKATGSHPDDRDPQPLKRTMERLVAEHGWQTEVSVHAMFGRWSSIVGPEIAQHCTPQRFVDGQLQVAADSTAWATQLRMLAPTVVAKLNEQVGDGTVQRITVVGPQAPSWKRGTRSVRGRGPRDTYG